MLFWLFQFHVERKALVSYNDKNDSKLLIYNGKKNVIEVGNPEYLSSAKVKGQISRINNHQEKGNKCKEYTKFIETDVSKILSN